MIHFDILKLENELRELENKTTIPDFWNDVKNSSLVLKRITELKNIVNKYKSIESDIQNVLELNVLLQDETDAELLKELVTKGKITLGGIVVCEYEQGNMEEQVQDLVQIKDRKYGYKRITIYKREED